MLILGTKIVVELCSVKELGFSYLKYCLQNGLNLHFIDALSESIRNFFNCTQFALSYAITLLFTIPYPRMTLPLNYIQNLFRILTTSLFRSVMSRFSNLNRTSESVLHRPGCRSASSYQYVMLFERAIWLHSSKPWDPNRATKSGCSSRVFSFL